jgi:RHS repeat-associated protein
MASISDKALKSSYAQNKHKYSGKELQNQEFSDGSGLEEYDFGARLFDPQIARWWVLDSKANKNPSWSPYVYAFDNPVRFIDPNGEEGFDFRLNDALKLARQSPVVQSLEREVGISSVQILKSDVQRSVSGVTTRGNRRIELSSNNTTETAALDYVWELTNVSNQGKLNSNDNKARKGQIDMKGFVTERFRTEAEAAINVMQASSDLKLDGGNFKDLVAAFKDDFQKMKEGKMTREDLAKKIADYGMANNPAIVQAYKEAYIDLYNEGAKQGVNEAEKKKKNNRDNP